MISIRKKISAAGLSILLMLTLLPCGTYADEGEKNTVSDSEACSIVGFSEFDVSEHYLAVSSNERPAESELISSMPAELSVILSDGSCTELPVNWYCVGDDYETTDASYVQFSPLFPEEYTTGEGICIESDAPYIGVFLLNSEQAVQAADSGALNGAALNDSGINGVTSYSYTSNPYEGRIYNYLIDQLGFSCAAACGILANIYLECSFYPNNLQNTYNKSLGMTDEEYTAAVDNGTYTNFIHDSAGYGLCQWTFWSRKQGLIEYARSIGAGISDYTMQLNFMYTEYSRRTSLKTILENAEDSAEGAYQCGHDWCTIFEQPANYESVGVVRGNLAKNSFWPIYSGDVSCIRISGATRYETAMETADELLVYRGSNSFDAIVLANAETFPDALSGVALAAQHRAPILLTSASGTDSGSLKTLSYIGNHLTAGGKVYILGGDSAVSEGVSDKLSAAGYQVTRLGGTDRYETNLKIIEETEISVGSDVYVATGKNFADVLSVSGYSAAKGCPIFLTDSGISQQTLTKISSIKPAHIYIIGGENAVPSSVEEELSAVSEVIRIAGSNRYETSAMAAELLGSDSADSAVIATGEKFPDGLVAGVLAAEYDIPVLLAAPGQYSSAASYLKSRGISIFYVCGGMSSVPDSVIRMLW